MHYTTLSALFLSISPLALASVLPILNSTQENRIAQENRIEDNRDEAVFLAKCTIYVTGNDASGNGNSDKLFYFKDYANHLNNGKTDDEDYAVGPGDKSRRVDYTDGTQEKPIHGQLNGLKFTAWDLNPKGDSHTNVTGRADLGGARMRCYANANANWKQELYSGKMYNKCYAQYYCTRTERIIRRTVYDISETVTSVKFTGQESNRGTSGSGLDVQYTLAHLFDQLKDHDKNKVDSAHEYKLGNDNSGTQMTFFIDRKERDGDVYYEEDRIIKIADLLNKELMPIIWAKDKKGDCKAWTVDRNRVDGYCIHTMPFPKQITVRVQTAEQAVLDWDDRDTVIINVKHTSSKNCFAEKTIATLFKAAFSAAAAVATGGASAAAAGLGVIVGKGVEASC
jgi:hypothetical protein